jgi:hypothetical protein
MMNILYLVDFEGSNGYRDKMSRVRFHGMKALSELTDVMWWGAGWPDYDTNITVQKNIDKLEEKPDLIVAFKPLKLKGIKDVDVPVCLRYNETYDWDWTTKEIDESGAEFVIFHHENDEHIPMSKYQEHYGDKVKFVYIPHCAEKQVFRDWGSRKEYDIMIGGATHSNSLLGQHYPLRDRMVGILNILGNMGYKVYKHPHPGYEHTDAHTDKYLVDFSKAINKAKICITCSGAPKSRFGKYIEIPMSGTAVAGDIPNLSTEDTNRFKEFVIELSMDMSDDEIIKKLIYYMDNKDNLNEITNKGLEWSKGYTQEYYAEEFMKHVIEYLESK